MTVHKQGFIQKFSLWGGGGGGGASVKKLSPMIHINFHAVFFFFKCLCIFHHFLVKIFRGEVQPSGGGEASPVP